MAESKKRDLDEIVELDVPYNNDDRKDKSVIISVNGNAWQLERGKTNKVPLYVKLEYKRQQKMIEDRNKYIEKVKKEMEDRQRETGMKI